MGSENVMRYHIKVWLASLKKPVVFRVGQEDMERFRRSFQGNRESFFVTPTDAGTHVAINLRHVELANLLWDAGPRGDAETEDDGDWITFYIRDRDPIHADVGEPLELIHALFTPETGPLEPDKVVSFTDADGELLMFDPISLLYLEVPTGVVTEREKEMQEQDSM